MILIALAFLGCTILVASIFIILIKRANKRMDEQNRQMKTYLEKYEKTKNTTTGTGNHDD